MIYNEPDGLEGHGGHDGSNEHDGHYGHDGHDGYGGHYGHDGLDVLNVRRYPNFEQLWETIWHEQHSGGRGRTRMCQKLNMFCC